MLSLRERNAEPIPGYRLLEPLGRGGFGEVWKCLAPGGLFKAIKFVAGDPTGLTAERAPATEELESLQRVKSVRHPFLLSIERFEIIEGELVIVMELAEHSLQDLLLKHSSEGQNGIDREELLDYLGEVANVLDYMGLRHGLQHLDIKPANLFVVADHVKVADFGLVRSLADRSGSVSLGAITPLYAAPELFHNRLSPSSDQYSLAIVYVELLTGKLPFDGKNGRQLLLQHTTEAPNLEVLPQTDRPIIARALAKDPAHRFASCTELINALLCDAGTERLTPSSALFRSPLVRVEAKPDTQRMPSQVDTRADLPTVATHSALPALEKYLPRFQFRSCLGRTPSTENWDAQSADGRRWLVRFLSGVVGHNPAREQAALNRLSTLQHDLLLPVQLIPAGPGCLLAVTELVETSLYDRFQEACHRGEEGLPRQKLLDWLWTAAEGLDELAKQEKLAHLGLHPRSLLFKGNCLRIADFGLLPLLWQPAGLLQTQVQPPCTAGEVLEMRGSSRSDQYSLAVIYQEMLTGIPPFSSRHCGAPDLQALPPAEQPIVARALDPDPEKRFASCEELIAALDRAGLGRSVSAQPVCAGSPSRDLLVELLAEAGSRVIGLELGTWLTLPDGEQALRSRFPASQVPGASKGGLESFRKQWNGQLLRTDQELVVFQISAPKTFWKRLFGRTPAVQVEVQWTRARPPTVPFPEVVVHIRCLDRSHPADLELLRLLGLNLLESLRTLLQGHPERRTQQRRLWTRPVQAVFRQSDGQFTEPIECFGKDVSLNGMGLYVPRPVPGSEVQLNFITRSRPEPVTLAGKCVRVQRCGEDWYEVGIYIN